MRAGLLKETITLNKPVITTNTFNEQVINWVVDTTTRARVTFNNGARKDVNNEIINTYAVTFIIRLYHNVTEDMQIGWNGKKYKIDSINPETDKQQITIIGELINE